MLKQPHIYSYTASAALHSAMWVGYRERTTFCCAKQSSRTQLGAQQGQRGVGGSVPGCSCGHCSYPQAGPAPAAGREQRWEGLGSDPAKSTFSNVTHLFSDGSQPHNGASLHCRPSSDRYQCSRCCVSQAASLVAALGAQS